MKKIKSDEKVKDNIDSWFFTNLVKGIIDALILLLNLLRPKDDKPTTRPDNRNPYLPLPSKPLFPWLRTKIDNIFSEKDKK